MNHRIPCEIVQDLMPMYVDGLTSEATSREVGEHLKECGPCREMYERMKKEVAQAGSETGAQGDEIDYLKKVRRRNLRNVILMAAAVFIIMIAAVCAKLFIIGSPNDSYMVTYTDVNQGQLGVGGVFYGSASVYRGYKIVQGEGDNTKLIIYTCLPSFWNHDGSFNLELDLPEKGARLDIGGITVNGDGTVISRQANQLYKGRNPYIGDVSANGKLASLLGISKELGNFKNELQTSSEPYGWTLRFEESASNSAVFEERMRAYACVLIALTDNLGQVSWTYTVETQDGPVTRNGSITEKEGSEYVGAPVKSFADSPDSVQKLLDLLEIGE